MRQKLSILRNLALGAGVALALAFGATQAWAKDPCTPLPPHTCKYQSDPDDYCTGLCIENDYPPFGHCLIEWDCCVCPEK